MVLFPSLSWDTACNLDNLDIEQSLNIDKIDIDMPYCNISVTSIIDKKDQDMQESLQHRQL